MINDDDDDDNNNNNNDDKDDEVKWSKRVIWSNLSPGTAERLGTASTRQSMHRKIAKWQGAGE